MREQEPRALQLFTPEEASTKVGKRIRTLVDFSGVPTGTEGIVNQAEMKTAASWAKATYQAIVNQYGLKGASRAAAQSRETGDSEEAPICQVHEVPMVRMNGRKGPFWSCHERNADGSFCSYRPKDQA